MQKKTSRAERKREYKAIKELKSYGWLTVRSAASHSPIDIVCLDWNKFLLIQVKPHKDKKAGKKELQSFTISPMVEVTKELWTYKKGIKEFNVETIK